MKREDYIHQYNEDGVALAPHAFIKGDFCLHGL